MWNLLQNIYLTLSILLHYLVILKIQIICKYSADMENAKKLHFQCTHFNSSTRITVYVECIMCFYQNLVLVAECHDDCWRTLQWRLLWRISTATNWSQIKQIKAREHSDTENFYLQSVRGKTRYLRHLKYLNLWMNNKVRSDKNAICLQFPISAECLQKLEFLISQGSVATRLRWGG